MSEIELYEVLNSFKQGIEMLLMKVENLEQRAKVSEESVQRLERTFIEDIYEPAQKAFDEAVAAEDFNRFSSKYKERLASLEEPLKAVEGDDFDLVRKAYEEYKALPADNALSEDEYVDKLIALVGSQLENIRERLGATKVELTADKSGVEVKAVDEDGSKSDTTVNVLPQNPDEIIDIADAILDDPSEVAEFERELASSLKAKQK